MPGQIQPFLDFSGGLNVETSNENLANNECPLLQNVDLSSRGSAKRRHGRTLVTSQAGNAQGMFYYYRTGQDNPDLIMAVSGQLYLKKHDSNSLIEVPILDGTDPFTFQTTLPIEAVQYRENLFIATGTKLVELTFDESEAWAEGTPYQVDDQVKANGYIYKCTIAGTTGTLAPNHTAGTATDGTVTWEYLYPEWHAATVTPYKPTTLEVINIGTNGLAENPSSYVQDGTGATIKIKGITPSLRVGVANEPTLFTTYVEKPADVEVEYKFNAASSDGKSTSTRDWDIDKSWSFTPTITGFYKIDGYVRKKHRVADNCDTVWDLVNTTNTSVEVSTTEVQEGTGSIKISSLSSLPSAGTILIEKTLVAPVKMSSTDRMYFWFKSESNGAVLGDNFEWDFIKADGTVLTSHRMMTSGNSKGDFVWKQKNSYPTTAYKDKTFTDVEITKIRLRFMGYSYLNETDDIRTSNYVLYFDDLKIGSKDSYDASYSIPEYTVKATYDPNANGADPKGIQTCRMIRIHWDRVLLTQENIVPGQVYISDLNNPRYFPVTNTINFSADKQEPVTSLIRFKNMLVVFTKTTIQTLTGKQPLPDLPEPYVRSLIHDGVGCIAGRSAQVLSNEIVFLSNEGLYMLVPNPYTLETLNVQRIDNQVKSQIPKDSNACSLVYDNQYWICFPSTNEIFRYYYQSGVWSKDKSTKLNLIQFLQYSNDIFNLSMDGKLYTHDKTVFTDDGEAYEMKLETKNFDLSAAFNMKKVKRLFVLAQHYDEYTVNLYTRVYADSRMILNPTTGQALDNGNGYEWVTTTSPNMKYYNTTQFGDWVLGESVFGDASVSVQEATVRGKCRRVKVSFTHNEPTACEIFGFGLEYKMKKP